MISFAQDYTYEFAWITKNDSEEYFTKDVWLIPIGWTWNDLNSSMYLSMENKRCNKATKVQSDKSNERAISAREVRLSFE